MQKENSKLFQRKSL